MMHVLNLTIEPNAVAICEQLDEEQVQSANVCDIKRSIELTEA